MSDTVIALREDCILAAEGKSGARPKITDARRIDVEGYGDPLEQWKQALIKYKQECRPDRVKLILPTTYSSARITQVPYAGGRELTKMAVNVMQEAAGDGIADYGIVQSDKKKGISVCTAAAEADTLEEILDNSDEICNEVNSQCRPLAYFEDYLKHGYYPFYLEGNAEYYTRIENIANLILEIELPQQCGVDISNVRKLKSLLGILSSEVPFMVDITKLSAMAELSRTTILAYLQYLDRAKLIHLLYSDNDSIKKLQKPDKIYMENTNLLYALTFKDVNKGTLREVFMVNQLAYQHRVEYCTRSADYTIDSKYTIEVGGKSKDGKQIANTKQAFIAADDIEYSAGNKIPLWAFGFLY